MAQFFPRKLEEHTFPLILSHPQTPPEVLSPSLTHEFVRITWVCSTAKGSEVSRIVGSSSKHHASRVLAGKIRGCILSVWEEHLAIKKVDQKTNNMENLKGIRIIYPVPLSYLNFKKNEETFQGRNFFSGRTQHDPT